MNAHADRTQKNKNQSVSNKLAQNQRSDNSTFQFIDNRPAAVSQRILQEMVNNSPQAIQAAQLKDLADSHSSRQSQIIQNRRVIQRLEQTDDGAVWSDNRLFVTNYDNDNELIGADNENLPELAGIEWADAGEAQHQESGDVLGLHRPTTEEADPIQVPQDCITTAEIVSAWVQNVNLGDIGTVHIPPEIEEANADTEIGPGDILFHMHNEEEGNFHGACVIATDDNDVVTMEADASEDEIDAMTPIFDMYAGHAGFNEEQDEGEDNERTYVIHVAEGRNDDEALWTGIQEAIDNNEYTDAGEASATFIRDAIHNANNNDDMEL